ncbi:hypothetical protein [Streptomyces sp. NPDC007110]|uniref:hypothetical protein n=1 Tax=Streptomyces sp. NPDC007110 TaxID=3156916 RepID=UPI003411E08B
MGKAAKAHTSQYVDSFTAVEALRASLDGAGIILPSLGVDPVMPELVELGRVRASVAMRLAEVLRAQEPAQ